MPVQRAFPPSLPSLFLLVWVHAALAAALGVGLLALQLSVEGALRGQALGVDAGPLSITLLKGREGEAATWVWWYLSE